MLFPLAVNRLPHRLCTELPAVAFLLDGLNPYEKFGVRDTQNAALFTLARELGADALDFLAQLAAHGAHPLRWPPQHEHRSAGTRTLPGRFFGAVNGFFGGLIRAIGSARRTLKER